MDVASGNIYSCKIVEERQNSAVWFLVELFENIILNVVPVEVLFADNNIHLQFSFMVLSKEPAVVWQYHLGHT